MDIRQSKLWDEYLQNLGWKSERLNNNCLAYIKNVSFLGSIIKIPKISFPISFREIDRLAKRTNAFFVKLEPAIEVTNNLASQTYQQLKASGFKQDKWALNPTKTFQIDLTKSEDDLLANMEKDTRYNVRLAARNGISVKETNNLEAFKKLYYETASRKGFWVPKKELETLWKIFSERNSAHILTAFYKGKPLAATVLLSTDNIGYYYHAASLNTHREVMAPYFLLWQAMRFLKKKGCRVLDLEGIYDPRIPTTKKWQGFTLFKKGFGGREVEYLGSFTKYYKLWTKILFFPTRYF